MLKRNKMEEQDNQLMLDLHNKQRSTDLIISEKLEAAAQSHAETMAKNRKTNS